MQRSCSILFIKEWAFLLIEYNSPLVEPSENEEEDNEEDVGNHSHKGDQRTAEPTYEDTLDLDFAFEFFFDGQPDQIGAGRSHIDEEQGSEADLHSWWNDDNLEGNIRLTPELEESLDPKYEGGIVQIV